MPGLTVSFNQAKLDKLQKKLGPEIIVPPLKTMMSAASRFAYDESRNRAPSFLAAIIDQKPPTAYEARIVAAHPAARAVESGRKPLIAGGRFPPPDVFLQMAHGVQSVAFILAATVAQRGTKGRFYMKKAISATNREMPALAQKCADAIAQAFAKP